MLYVLHFITKRATISLQAFKFLVPSSRVFKIFTLTVMLLYTFVLKEFGQGKWSGKSRLFENSSICYCLVHSLVCLPSMKILSCYSLNDIMQRQFPSFKEFFTQSKIQDILQPKSLKNHRSLSNFQQRIQF